MERLVHPTELDRILAYPRGRSARLARKGLIPAIHLPDGEIRFNPETITRLIEEGSAALRRNDEPTAK